ncbi:hypothetical protein CPC197_0809B, partial [Chlamydia psittaci C1/97]
LNKAHPGIGKFEKSKGAARTPTGLV